MTRHVILIFVDRSLYTRIKNKIIIIVVFTTLWHIMRWENYPVYGERCMRVREGERDALIRSRRKDKKCLVSWSAQYNSNVRVLCSQCILYVRFANKQTVWSIWIILLLVLDLANSFFFYFTREQANHRFRRDFNMILRFVLCRSIERSPFYDRITSLFSSSSRWNRIKNWVSNFANDHIAIINEDNHRSRIKKKK